MKPLLKGRLVRLSAMDAEEMSKYFAAWNRDSELMRLMDSGPSVPHSAKKSKEWLEKQLNELGQARYWFTIRALEDGCLLGDIELEITDWNRREAFVGLGIGPSEFRGKGYGTEAMQLALEYAFLELNLNRVTLNVFEYNPRAVRSYEKAGFRHEGRMREALFREGRRWDLIYMGILRQEWMEKYGCNPGNE
ncbi:MAG: GNAT family N-acetyltransferase [Bacteroidota bacterium]